MPSPVPSGAGAAAVERASIGDLSVAGDVTSRVARSDEDDLAEYARQLPRVTSLGSSVKSLPENTLYQNMHGEGRARRGRRDEARMTFNSRLADAVQAHDDIFSEMKKSGLNMTRQDFDKAIAARRAPGRYRRRLREPRPQGVARAGVRPVQE